ncbi:ABC-2 type transport system ATP-binding protein [Psychrobacillus sp. OK028]|uniref:ABC transporter ATP-binding protein n=1 Tax=Psychrobacillus sp. OK028 TaxID=1884359 RepID=UPI000889E8F7|nr:ABC transporter ATP-binding protein [Psychrobacillus sp. OK028]SDO19807.1 ABC-2 type transport system ATP-binding protein [Psychrobacillus sp. OK028]
MKTLLHVQGLTKEYGKETAINQVTFSLIKNTATALIGPNGAGKTTTLSILAGLLNQTSGSVVIDGEIKGDIRREIGFLPQYPQFYSWLTALEFIEMVAKFSGIEAKMTKSQAIRTLDFVGLGDAKNKKTGTFSGGMKQRLGLAQAIVHKPGLLLLDEPVSALDPVGRREVLNLLKELQEHTTILYSTHILNDAEEMTDQLLFLRKGQLVEQGSLKEVRDKYANPLFKIIFADTEEAAKFVEISPWPARQENEVVFIHLEDNKPTMNELIQVLANSNLRLSKVERASASLEEIFLQVVNKVE